MTLHWKGGLVFLFFVISYPLFLLSSYTSWGTEYQRYFSDSFRVAAYLAVAGIIFLLMFLFSLHFTGRRIEQERFTYGWLALYNAGVAAAVYLVAILISIALAWPARGEEGLLVWFVVFFGLVIVPIGVLLFSVLPAFLVVKYSHTQVIRYVFVFFLVLSCLILVYIFLLATCGLNTDQYCVAERSADFNNLDACLAVTAPFYRHQCLGRIARQRQDPSVCDMMVNITDLDVAKTRVIRDGCVLATNLDACLAATGYSDACVREIAWLRQDPSLCEHIVSNSTYAKRDCVQYATERVVIHWP